MIDEEKVEESVEQTPQVETTPEAGTLESETPESVTAESATQEFVVPEAEKEQSAAATDKSDQQAETATEGDEQAAQESDGEEANDQDFPPLEDGKWYVVHCYSGYEEQAKKALIERVRSSKREKEFGRILIPSENVTEMVRGKKRSTNKRFFPGYILVNMLLSDETWHLVKNTPKITGFVGGKTNPPAVPEREITKITSQLADGTLQKKQRVSFEKGESVRVIEGPFVNFNGIVDEVRPEKGKLRVLVSIFGRSTPVELDFVQVEKN